MLSRRRDSYREYAHRLGLDGLTATPVEVLVRGGGGRATDTFHIVDDLRSSRDGLVESRFLASGAPRRGRVRSDCGAPAGQELQLRDEPANPVNRRALLIDVKHGCPVGDVPDWLVDDVHVLRGVADEIKFYVGRVNPDARPHLQSLRRLQARVADILSLPGVEPRNITAFTFTKRAAAELKDRVRGIVREQHGALVDMAEMLIGTMHAYRLDLLPALGTRHLQVLGPDRHHRAAAG